MVPAISDRDKPAVVVPGHMGPAEFEGWHFRLTTLPPPSVEAKPDLRCLLERRNWILEEQSILSRHTPMYSPGPGPLFQRRPHANTPAPLEPEIQSGCRSTSLTSRLSPSFHGRPTLPTADVPHAKPPALIQQQHDSIGTPRPSASPTSRPSLGEADSLANGSLARVSSTRADLRQSNSISSAAAHGSGVHDSGHRDGGVGTAAADHLTERSAGNGPSTCRRQAGTARREGKPGRQWEA